MCLGVAGLAPGTADGPAPPQGPARPYPAEEMTRWPVTPWVGNVRNNEPSLIEPVAGAGQSPRREGATNLHKRLAALFLILALWGCAQVAGTGAGRALFAR